ncbi:MAG: hypothetical protein KDD33_06610 [Bdellovibrionales bacterium]|nr:hypothetical protein [Bdellovibrionales bacterium]
MKRHFFVMILFSLFSASTAFAEGAPGVQCDTKYPDARQAMETGEGIDLAGRVSEQCSLSGMESLVVPGYTQYVEPCLVELNQLKEGKCHAADLPVDVRELNTKKFVRSQMAQAYQKLKQSETHIKKYRDNCAPAFKRAIDRCIAQRERALAMVDTQPSTCTASDRPVVKEVFKKMTSALISYHACEILNRNVGARADEEEVEQKKLQVEASGVSVTSDPGV